MAQNTIRHWFLINKNENFDVMSRKTILCMGVWEGIIHYELFEQNQRHNVEPFSPIQQKTNENNWGQHCRRMPFLLSNLFRRFSSLHH